MIIIIAITIIITIIIIVIIIIIILENEDYKILWDFSIQTDPVIEVRRPDLVVVDKKERICKIDFIKLIN